ncbi:neural cell adhesion molecule 2-like [Mytilus trossulus]|uniref:neural cell adhesion molecule 2-like n=1 Tax=Mytilus trossulus TaxID=6551 RepID=UPI0030049F51
MSLRLLCNISSFLEIFILCATHSIDTHNIFISNGDSVILKCDVLPNSKSTWDKENPRANKTYKEVIPQADGKYINPKIPNKNRLEIVGNISKGDYNLQIQNVSSSDEGTYKCSQKVNGTIVREHHVTLQIEVKPKNVEVLHSENGFIDVEEGKFLNLTCSVQSGIPPETITWFNRSSPVKSGGPGNLTISFITQKNHHNNQFSCKVEADSLLIPIYKNITIDIKYKPYVKFIDSNPIIVTENNNLTLLCSSDGNPMVNEMQILNQVNNQVLTRCLQSTCSFTISKIKRKDAGIYICNAENTFGITETVVKVNITYPPSVTVTQHIGRLALQCNPDGNPPTYTFHLWKHRSKFGETIRKLNYSRHLNFPTSERNYHKNGVYICSVENGIEDINGLSVQSGQTIVQLTDKPIFVSQNSKTQYGRFGHYVDITVYVYSFPELTSVNVVRNDTCFVNKNNLVYIENSTLIDTLFNTEFRIIGTTIRLHRYNLTKDDFTFYQFNVTNKIGHAIHAVELTAADKPEKPNIKEVIPGIENLKVSWTSTFNGGKEQQFILEYKTVEDSKWNKVSPINETFDNCCHHVIENLVASTDYMVRIHATNELGDSKFTDIKRVKTVAVNTDQSGITSTIIGLILGIVVVVTVLTLSLFLYLKRGYFIKTKFPSQSSIQDDELQDEMAVENYIYQSQGNTLENRNQQVQSDKQRSANRQKTPLLQGSIESPYQNHFTANSLKNEASLAVENNLYHSQTSGNLLRRMHHCDKSSVNFCRNASRDNMLQNMPSHSNERTFKIAHEQYNGALHYVEVVVDPLDPTKEVRIHGTNDRTIYADIETGVVGVPLNEIDRDDDDTDEDDDDDFMYIDGIIDYTKKS